jgi:hypothetical protein
MRAQGGNSERVKREAEMHVQSKSVESGNVVLLSPAKPIRDHGDEAADATGPEAREIDRSGSDRGRWFAPDDWTRFEI